jgi:5-methylcytosine-specific restriction enzyme subunit McrC
VRDTLTVLEHGELPIGGPAEASLSAVEADRLERIAERRPGFCSRRRSSIRFAQYAGLVSLGDRMLEVLPKVDEAAAPAGECRGVLLRLLRLAPKLRIHDEGAAVHGLRQGALLEVFLNAWFDELGALIRGGLLRRYRRHAEDLNVVRGRLNIQRQIAVHAMRPDLLACSFDTLSADNDWNRVLKAALSACRGWLISLPLRRRWSELWVALEDVALPANPREVFERLSPDRQSARYAVAVRWARWVVASATPDLRAGDADAPAMLFDTNALFEEAVATSIRARLKSRESGWLVRTQVTDRHLASVEASGRAAIGLRPDLVFEQDGQTVAIADTKWKRVGVSHGELRPDPQDVHQMLAYAAAFACDRLALVYPWHAGLEGVRPTRLRLPAMGGREPVLEVICLDVGADELNKRLGALNGVWL